MPVTNYYTVDGEIIGEKTSGGSRIDYLTDALGSVTATVNQSAQVVNTYRYKPYGKQLSKSGVGADPKFQWVGTQGYRQTGRSYSDVYVRARHYDTSTARWTTKDPIGMDAGYSEDYIYCLQNPLNRIDASGLISCIQSDCCKKIEDAYDRKTDKYCTATCDQGVWTNYPMGHLWGMVALIHACEKRTKADCDRLKKSLIFVASQCMNACNNVQVDIQGGPHAWTCCCQDQIGSGSWKVCGTKYCLGTDYVQGWDKPANACILSCLAVHENYHAQDCKATQQAPQPGVPLARISHECCPYRRQMECMRKLYTRTCGNDLPPEVVQCYSASKSWGCRDK